MEKQKNVLAITLLVILSLIWGTSFILIKQGLKALGPTEVGALRIVAASVFLLPFAITRVGAIKRSVFIKLFISGVMGVMIPSFLFAVAQTQISSSLAGVLNSLSPLWTMIVGALFFGQRFRGWVILGVAISFGGCVVLIMAKSGGAVSGFNYYALLVVLAAALYGINLNFIKYKIPGLTAMTMASVSLLLVGPLAAIYLFSFTDFIPHMTHHPGAWRAFGMIVLLAFMSTAVAHWIFYKLLFVSTPLFASSVTYLIPVVAVIWGLWDGEKVLLSHYIGMAAILGGVYIANRK